MNKKVVTVISVITFVGLLAASAHAQSSLLSGRIWRLEAIEGKSVGQSTASIEFEPDGRGFSGDSGCNRIFGSVAIGSRSIKFSAIGTRKMCRGRVMQLESRLSAALAKASTYQITGERLLIYSGRREVLRFSGVENAGHVRDEFGLGDRKWLLTSIRGKLVPKLEQQPFIVFDPAESNAGGNSSCNVFSASYKVSGDTITISRGIMTLRACVEDKTNVEQRFFEALDEADRFEIRANTLVLFKGKTPILTFNGTAKAKRE